MTRRAVWLVVLNFLLPGSVQVLAGNRRLGRLGIVSTIVLLALVIVAVATYAGARNSLISAFTSVPVLWAVQIVLIYFVVLWIVLTLDTLRLVRIVYTGPSARFVIAGLTIVALAVVAGTTGYGAIIAGATRGVVQDVFSGGKMADPIDGRYNILLLGGDAGKGRVGLRPDSISVVSIDATTGKTTIIGIPRNLQRAPFVKGSPLYKPYPNGYSCGVDCLVSYLYTYGEAHPNLYPNAVKDGSEPGIEAMRDVIEGVTGLTLQYFVLIDMGGFSKLINALGGIDIDSTGRYPIGGQIDANGQPINVDGWVDPGQQHMSGFTALWYARARHGTSDYDRMQRQRQVQVAILAQFQPAIVMTKFQAIAKAGSQTIRTDIPSGMLSGFADLALKSRAHKITELELVPSNGINVIHPDFTQIHAMVKAAVPSTASSGKN